MNRTYLIYLAAVATLGILLGNAARTAKITHERDVYQALATHLANKYEAEGWYMDGILPRVQRVDGVIHIQPQDEVDTYAARE